MTATMAVVLFGWGVALYAPYQLFRLLQAPGHTFAAILTACVVLALDIAMGYVHFKLSFVPYYYVLNGNGQTFADAIHDSWHTVSGGTWWQVFLIKLCAALAMLPAVVLTTMYRHKLGSVIPLEPLILYALLYTLGGIVATTWAPAAVAALFSAPETEIDVLPAGSGTEIQLVTERSPFL